MDDQSEALQRQPENTRRQTEAMLDAWVDAKRAKDFHTADRIRNELRASGIDPEQERPSKGSDWSMKGSDWSRSTQRQSEDMLDKWVEAKRNKDFETADL